MKAITSPQDFVETWRANRNKERSASQEHFIDLCRMLGVPTPNQADPTGEHYAFEKGATKQLGGQGWADVWKRACFAWEYKGKHADLDKAYRQLQQYRESLENPPLLITSDLERIIIHTNFTSSVKRVYEVTLDDIAANDWVAPITGNAARALAGSLKPLELLQLIFKEYPADQHPLRSPETTEKVTQKAAELFGEIAREMQQYGDEPQATAHFLIRVLFCLFAEDIGLLPRNLMRDMIVASEMKSRNMASRLRQLFLAMRDGGSFGNDDIRYFNGGLFDNNEVLELTGNALITLQQVSGLDWSAIEPSIFGMLFERGLDPAKRSQLGAHYTGIKDMQLIVQPVLMEPLRREWIEVQANARNLMGLPLAGDVLSAGVAMAMEPNSQQREAASQFIEAFHRKLATMKVLDPACGSGNFLYVALRELLTLEKEVITLGNTLGLSQLHPQVTPAQLFGIELNSYAHELAQATVWIGYIQWRHENGFGYPDEPILRKLDNIRNTDALIDIGEGKRREEIVTFHGHDKVVVHTDASEREWPEADVIIGNPPFLGGKRLRSELGNKYVDALFDVFEYQVPGEADLVCYWFEKARAMIEKGKAKRVGLIATQGIRGGANRKVLEQIKRTGDIFFAWSDRNWILNGATVHVSFVGFDGNKEKERFLNGISVSVINSNLTSSLDLTKARLIPENLKICHMGDTKGGAFDIEANLAQKMLLASGNPNGRPNSDVIKPWVNASDITQTRRGMYIIDFGSTMSEEDAAQYEVPFEFVKKFVKPVRDGSNRVLDGNRWWMHARSRPALKAKLLKIKRCIVTPGVSKHRVFAWVDSNVVVDHALLAFVRDDDYFFGVLHSKLHELWARGQGTQLREAESGFRYTPESTFETFPFPWPPSKEPQADSRVQAIAQAAKELVEKRDRWLAEVESAQDVDPAYLTGLNAPSKKPKRSEARTLTNLYNLRPTWLDLAHQKLDRVVFAAYGWPHDLSDEEILSRLLALNLERNKE